MRPTQPWVNFLGSYTLKEYYQEESRVRMEALIANLLEAYRQSISELEWMSDETKQQALVKLSNFTPRWVTRKNGGTTAACK